MAGLLGLSCFRRIMIKSYRGRGVGGTEKEKEEEGKGKQKEEEEELQVLLTTRPLGQSAMGMISV